MRHAPFNVKNVVSHPFFINNVGLKRIDISYIGVRGSCVLSMRLLLELLFFLFFKQILLFFPIFSI